MKTKLLLLLLAVSTINTNAQIFDWETATLFNIGCTDCAAEQTVNGNYVSFRDTNSSLINLSHVGVGTTGLSVRNSQPQPESFLTFYPSIDVQSLRLFATASNQNWTISQLDSSGNVLNTTTTTVNIASSVVSLNWTNVHQIEIKVTAGYDHSFGVDDIVFTPCTVTIPDVNFKAALVANTAINTNGDSEIQCSEATAFTGAINVNSVGISDLTGIEAFTFLTELYCANNQLTNLDLSANTALTILNCNNNLLTNIDVSNSAALTGLRCDTNQLSALDVSNNIALTSLVCFSNSLTSLNVITNTVLTTLDCSYNSLTSLNLSTNTALTTLTCRTNALTSLDVTTNTALTFLNCFDTQIPSLDVSANTVLTTMFCGDNTQLTSLNVANGNNVNVANFNTTNCSNLTCIQVDDVAYSTTNWTSIDAQTSFSTNCTPCTVNIPDTNFKAYLVGNTTINTNGDTEIQCSEATAFTGTMNVNNSNISDLTGIEAFTSLNQLRCGGNSLTTLDVSQNTTLTQLHCGYNSLSSIDVSNNLSLIILAASNNQLANINVTLNTQLLALRVSNNLISNVDLSSNSSLVALEIYNNQFSAIDISANTNLIHLYVQNNNITSLDVSSHSALNYLDVSNNDLTSLNVANGNNTNFYDASNGGGSGNPAMDARQNPSLSCIQIDAGFTPPNSPSSSRWEKDATASYNSNCALGVSDYELNTINIYPNPVSNTLNIKLEHILDRVEVYNLQGQKLLETKQDYIHVSGLSSGVYLLKVYSKNGNVGIKRFVKH